MKILFVCKHNRFRSQIAEQFFRKYNKNKNISASSAGIFQGRYPLDKTEEKTARKFEIKINKRPRTIKTTELAKTDTIVVVANDVQKSLFTYQGKYIQKVIVWKIPDEFSGNKNKIEDIIKSIELKVKKLVKTLENKK